MFTLTPAAAAQIRRSAEQQSGSSALRVAAKHGEAGQVVYGMGFDDAEAAPAGESSWRETLEPGGPLKHLPAQRPGAVRRARQDQDPVSSRKQQLVAPVAVEVHRREVPRVGREVNIVYVAKNEGPDTVTGLNLFMGEDPGLGLGRTVVQNHPPPTVQGPFVFGDVLPAGAYTYSVFRHTVSQAGDLVNYFTVKSQDQAIPNAADHPVLVSSPSTPCRRTSP